MINEFNELIEEKELLEIADRIKNLAAEKIDLLWYKCGWIDVENHGKNKALSSRKIVEIKENKDLSRAHTSSLLLETPKGEVIKELSDLENS